MNKAKKKVKNKYDFNIDEIKTEVISDLKKKEEKQQKKEEKKQVKEIKKIENNDKKKLKKKDKKLKKKQAIKEKYPDRSDIRLLLSIKPIGFAYDSYNNLEKALGYADKAGSAYQFIMGKLESRKSSADVKNVEVEELERVEGE